MLLCDHDPMDGLNRVLRRTSSPDLNYVGYRSLVNTLFLLSFLTQIKSGDILRGDNDAVQLSVR